MHVVTNYANKHQRLCSAGARVEPRLEEPRRISERGGSLKRPPATPPPPKRGRGPPIELNDPRDWTQEQERPEPETAVGAEMEFCYTIRQLVDRQMVDPGPSR